MLIYYVFGEDLGIKPIIARGILHQSLSYQRFNYQTHCWEQSDWVFHDIEMDIGMHYREISEQEAIRMIHAALT